MASEPHVRRPRFDTRQAVADAGLLWVKVYKKKNEMYCKLSLLELVLVLILSLNLVWWVAEAKPLGQ